MATWLKTDEKQDAIVALEMTLEELKEVSNDVRRWKWVIIALHNALQGFMVIVLTVSGNSINIWTKDDAKEWLKAYEKKEALPEEGYMDKFLNLYKKIKSDRILVYTNSKKLRASPQQNQSVKSLNDIRNNFIHLGRISWSIEISGLPQLARDCVQIIAFLVNESGNFFLDTEENEQHVRDSISQILGEINGLKDS